MPGNHWWLEAFGGSSRVKCIFSYNCGTFQIPVDSVQDTPGDSTVTRKYLRSLNNEIFSFSCDLHRCNMRNWLTTKPTTTHDTNCYPSHAIGDDHWAIQARLLLRGAPAFYSETVVDHSLRLPSAPWRRRLPLGCCLRAGFPDPASRRFRVTRSGRRRPVRKPAILPGSRSTRGSRRRGRNAWLSARQRVR